MTILALGGASMVIGLKLKEEKPVTARKKTRAAEVTYNKVVDLNQMAPTQVITEAQPELITLTSGVRKEPSPAQQQEPSPTVAITIPEIPTFTPMPTEIQLVTTPIITNEPTSRQLAYNNPSPTTADLSQEITATPTVSSITISPTKKTVESLPQSGLYNYPLLISVFALLVIFISFVV